MPIIIDLKVMRSTGNYFSIILLMSGSMIVSPRASVVQAAVGSAEAMDDIADPGIRVAQNAEEQSEQEDEQEGEQEAVEPKSESPAVANPATPAGATSPGVDAKTEENADVKPEEKKKKKRK